VARSDPDPESRFVGHEGADPVALEHGTKGTNQPSRFALPAQHFDAAVLTIERRQTTGAPMRG
jgi:hypothetical protein